MFEGYTERAQRIIHFAKHKASQPEARTGAIEPAHLLLALVRDLPEIISAAPRDIASMRRAIHADITPADMPATEALPLSAPSKRALAYAAEEVERMAWHTLDAVHLFLGVMRECPELVSRTMGLADISI